jgi:hypothetical protein
VLRQPNPLQTHGDLRCCVRVEPEMWFTFFSEHDVSTSLPRPVCMFKKKRSALCSRHERVLSIYNRTNETRHDDVQFINAAARNGRECSAATDKHRHVPEDARVVKPHRLVAVTQEMLYGRPLILGPARCCCCLCNSRSRTRKWSLRQRQQSKRGAPAAVP